MRYLYSKKSSPPSVTPPPPTQSEQSQLPLLLSTITSQTTLTTSETSLFATSATLLRYLRARNHDISKAATMLQASIQHFRTTPAPPVCPTCTVDPASHSFFPIGPAYDLTDSPLGDVIPVMYSNFHVKNREPNAVSTHMQSCMDAAFDANSAHRMIWVMDFAGFSRADVSPTSAKRVLTLFADHYPERLGCAVIYDAPRAFAALWAAVKMFAAPETVQKVIFVKRGEEELFHSVGIVGKVFERVCDEIRMAREGERGGNWWGRPPMKPLVDYGGRVLQAGEEVKA